MGEGGSGQPAIVFAGQVDMESESSQWKLSLIGHSSPDGSDGTISKDLTKLSSALDIVESVIIIKR